MKNNRLVFLSFVLLLIWAVSSLILLEQMPLDPPQVAAGQKKIKVLIRTGTESGALRQISTIFEKETGIKVEFTELGRDVYFTSVGTQLLAGTEAFDIVSVPNTSIAQFASARAILPLDPFMQDTNLTDLDALDLDDFLAVYRYQGITYALPTDISTHFLYYRSDLIPQPPETWDELYKTALRFTKSINSDSPTVWGLTMPAVAPEERTKIFASLLWSHGGDVLTEKEGNVQFDSIASIQAGEYLEKLIRQKIVPQDLLNWDFSRTREGLLMGEAAMAAPYWNAAYPMIKNSNSPFKDAIRIAMVPGIKDASGRITRVPFQHGWTLAINASSNHPLEAWEFIKFATGKRGGAVYARNGGVPARRSILGDVSFRETRPDFSLILETMGIAKNEPSVSYYPAMVDIEEKALAKIVTMYESAKDSFSEAAQELRQLTGRMNRNSR
ncbi:ABC transporter substrate-binding protein [Cohnella kolymensis]|uniref:ABC transporter substrate-binding protein n=1 Tax=Cohnella kolymensis TaxID=1590652 RepID=UPI000A77EEA8|nr:sugar ABC transporter substrate-binding protein [Cohnella kolymensis]